MGENSADSHSEPFDVAARIAEIRSSKKADGKPLATLTAYDYPSARILEEEGIDLILVGDSLGMAILGFPDTTHVTMDHMLHHTAAVMRGVQHTVVAADLPYKTYETVYQALENAVQLQNVGAHILKMEGGVEKAGIFSALHREGFELMGHIGMLPQNILVEGKYNMKGKTPDGAQQLMDDAKALEDAGAMAIVLELVKPDVAAEITAATRVPTIGVGSGPHCDAQILVTSDLVGGFPWFRPKFAPKMADTAEEFRRGIRDYITSCGR